MSELVAERIRFVLCDLDGVVWLAQEPLPGAAAAVAAMRASGRRVLFVTNFSAGRIADHEAALHAAGIPAVGDVVSSAEAAASLLEPDSVAMVGGGPGVFEAIEARGARAVGTDFRGDVDAVLVGLDRTFDYEKLAALAAAVRAGARFVATNDDATLPTPTGPMPGAGSIVAAIATASGRTPEIAGKPHLPMAALVRARCGPTFAPDAALMVGDRWSTDGAFAHAVGCAYAQVRSGVTPRGAPLEGDAAIDVDDLAAVSRVLLRTPK